MTNEEHVEEFFSFLEKNEKRLKKNLRKNITFNPDIFDDVFNDTVIRVYNAIMNGSRIDDFEQYFFIASKFAYIAEDNKERDRKVKNDGDILWNISHGFEQKKGTMTGDGRELIERTCVNDGEWKEKEERAERINQFMKYLARRLSEQFSPHECDIFLIYYRLKSEKAGISYQKLAGITGHSFNEISTIIQSVKKWIRNDEEINKMKKEIINGID